MFVRLPKISPSVYCRETLHAWLAFHAAVPLRYVCAPPGSGKTTVAVMYARSRPNAVAYVRIRPDMDPRILYAEIGLAAGLRDIDSYEALLAGFARFERAEIIVDDIDAASGRVRGVLQRLYDDVVESVTFIYLARSFEAIEVAAGVARGLVAMCDPGMFAFRTDEIALYAQSLGLTEDTLSLARLQRGTQGWSMAVAGVCREAAGSGKRLSEAWPRWQQLARRSIAEAIADALRFIPVEVAEHFERCTRGEETVDEGALACFARFGLFVAEHDGHLLLNPLVATQAGDTAERRAHSATASASIMMFGRFDFSIDGRPIVWQRRRDRQIVQYLALQPNGRATRAQLIATFWPNADRQLAAQSLRTACSTIRRAFGSVTGPANVDRFFVADYVVELKLGNIESSVARFRGHVLHADRAYEAGDARSAYMHYAAAERLYVAPLLSGEPPADWSEAPAAHVAALHLHCAERLDVLAHQVRSDEVAGFNAVLEPQACSA